jgi:phosphatidylglycerophosphate synthase
MNTEKYVYDLANFIAPHICCIHPNVITGVGFILTPVIWTLLKSSHAHVLLVIVTLFRGFLDCLDGTVARRCNKQTAIGSKLDILSDFIFGVMIYTIAVTHLLISKHSQQWYSVGIILVSTWVIIRMSEMVYLQCTGHKVNDSPEGLQWLQDNSTFFTSIVVYVLYLFLQWK